MGMGSLETPHIFHQSGIEASWFDLEYEIFSHSVTNRNLPVGIGDLRDRFDFENEESSSPDTDQSAFLNIHFICNLTLQFHINMRFLMTSPTPKLFKSRRGDTNFAEAFRY